MIRVFFIVFLTFFAYPFGACAQLIINEIAWMGTPTQGVDSRQWWRYEWIELYNVSDTDVSVAGWSIALYRENLDYEIPLQGKVGAKDYFVVAASSQINETDVNYATLAGKFVNSGQRVQLKDATGNNIEEVNAAAGWFGGDNKSKTTMERRFPDRDANDPENWGSSIETGGTPGTKNTILGREAIMRLDKQRTSFITKESSRELPFLSGVFTAVFMLALLLAGGSALLVLALHYYLLRQDVNSSYVQQD